MIVNKRKYLSIIFTFFCFLFVFLSASVVLAVDGNGNDQSSLPDLVPLPAPKPEPPHLNDPPKTYPGQVIIKYTQDIKEFRDDGLPADNKVLTATVAGTIYRDNGAYLFKEGQISWNYNEKNYDNDMSCQYLITSVGAGNIDIAHTNKISQDSKIWIEDDEKYTMDINNNGRFYLTADGIPTENISLAMTPLSITKTLISGNAKFCAQGGAPTNDVPPIINIRLENLKAIKNIISGEKVIRSGGEAPQNGDLAVTEMVSYTIELPSAKQNNNALEDNGNSGKQGLLEKLWNWIKNLF